ncbi:MAG: hypothetical protein BWY70_01814 [Bacteroidetes bacterium ADurb.Bin408]|nr:MAG: hypothetical protein BWY70_01814 [Bacteroidetes bacterium ADurb.Bin408]
MTDCSVSFNKCAMLSAMRMLKVVPPAAFELNWFMYFILFTFKRLQSYTKFLV